MSDPIKDDNAAEPLRELAEHMPSAPVAPAHGIAAIALSMAMKFHDINTIQDGTLYQQYKLEGKNMRALHIDHVFETAERMEIWLLASSNRIAEIVVEALAHDAEDDGGADQKQESPAPETTT